MLNLVTEDITITTDDVSLVLAAAMQPLKLYNGFYFWEKIILEKLGYTHLNFLVNKITCGASSRNPNDIIKAISPTNKVDLYSLNLIHIRNEA